MIFTGRVVDGKVEFASPLPLPNGTRVRVEPVADPAPADATAPAGERKPLIGRLAHLGLKTPSLDEFKEASREAWANFPRDFPDPAKK